MITIERLSELLRYPIVISEFDCWLFTGGSKNGFHGSLYYEGKSWQAHRLAWHLANGPIPNAMNVLHKCDIGICINPDHLFLGTQQDNIEDMVLKGRENRVRKGEENGRAMIKENDVLEIRRLFNDEVGVAILAEKFKLTKSTIYKIVRHELWRHI